MRIANVNLLFLYWVFKSLDESEFEKVSEKASKAKEFIAGEMSYDKVQERAAQAKDIGGKALEKASKVKEAAWGIGKSFWGKSFAKL